MSDFLCRLVKKYCRLTLEEMATISIEEFVQLCQSVVKASDVVKDGWELKNEDAESIPFLCKKFVKPFTCSSNDKDNCFVLIECHVLYSESYANPVLYFSACKTNGQTLKLEECWNMVSNTYNSVFDSENKWSFITQDEHPIFYKPYFRIHPCHTQDFMKPFAECSAKCHYLVSWLSVVLPVLTLDFPVESYYKYFYQSSLS